MRNLIAIMLVEVVHAAAYGCPIRPEQFDVYEGRGLGFISGSSARDRLPLYRKNRGVVPARPTFYERGRHARDGGEVPEFRRADGSLIPYAGPYPISDGMHERRIDLHIDEGIILVSYPSARRSVRIYYIDAALVPRTRSTRFERDMLGDWLHIDTDAVALRIEERGRSPKIQFKTDAVVFDAAAARVIALYDDGREEVIFSNTADSARDNALPAVLDENVGDKPLVDKPVIAEARRADARWPHGLLLIASLLCCMAIGRRIATTARVGRAD